jgi:hypothetical protein
VEGALQNSFMHSLLAKGKLLYTHEDSLIELCSRLQQIGERDTRLQLLSAAIGALTVKSSRVARTRAPRLVNPQAPAGAARTLRIVEHEVLGRERRPVRRVSGRGRNHHAALLYA